MSVSKYPSSILHIIDPSKIKITKRPYTLSDVHKHKFRIKCKKERSQGQVEAVFKDGVGLIQNLLVDNKIDKDTATQVLEILLKMYIEHKIDSTIQGYLEYGNYNKLLSKLVESAAEAEEG